MFRRVFSIGMVAGFAFAGQLVATSSTLAADPSLPEAPTTYDWSGPYIGLHAGYQFGGGVTYEDQEASDFDGPGHPMHDKVDGFLGGLHVGYNKQFGNFVFGAEASIDAGGQSAHRLEVPAIQYVVDTDVKLMASVAGRAGVAFDRFLAFGKLGVAYINYDYSASFQAGGTTTARSNGFSDVGFVFGGGVEYALTDRFIIGIEYERQDFGSKTDNIARAAGTTCCGDDVLRADFTADIVKARVGLRF